MDFKEIAVKELSGEDVSDKVKDFTPEQKSEYLKVFSAEADVKKQGILADINKATTDKDEELKAVEALRKEKQRLTVKPETDPAHSGQEVEEYKKQQREEQIQKARSRFVKDFNLSDDDLSKLDESFKTEDSGKLDADFIYEDFKKAYVKSNPDRFIEAEREKRRLEANANEFNAQGAGAKGGSGGGEKGKEYSSAVHQAVKEARKAGLELTLEEAEKGLKFGNTWRKV